MKPPWKHTSWGTKQLDYFADECKIRREKNIEDYIINNNINNVHLIKDNNVLDDFVNANGINKVSVDKADMTVITDQRFSRLTPDNIILHLDNILLQCPVIYFALNRYYLNASETYKDTSLSNNFDAAIVQWLQKKLTNAIVINRSEIFPEDGSWFTWVIPSCEIIICRK